MILIAGSGRLAVAIIVGAGNIGLRVAEWLAAAGKRLLKPRPTGLRYQEHSGKSARDF